jgi:antitoxin component YwqK of YwqJK toxin-antitoxin module
MRKIAILNFLLILSLVSSAQFFHRKINQFDKKGLRQGLWLMYLDENKKMLNSREHYKDGRETGVCRYFHPNGKLRLKFRFRHHDIKVKYYDEHRRLTHKGTSQMEYNQKDIHYYWTGLWKFYNPHHRIKTIALFQKESPPVILKGELSPDESY